jgi:hypothetical protein
VYDEEMNQGDTEPFSRGKGLDVRTVSYHYPKGRKITIEDQIAGFYHLECGGDGEWIECVHEPVVCWMYLPDPPKYTATWNKEENRLIFGDILHVNKRI